MINQVLSVNTAQTRAFSNFSQPKNGYYINAPFNEEEKKENNHKLGKLLQYLLLLSVWHSCRFERRVEQRYGQTFEQVET